MSRELAIDRARQPDVTAGCVGCAGRQRSFCSALSPDGLRELATQTRSRELESGDHLFFPDEELHFAFIVRAGAVKLYKLLPDGRCQIVDILYPGDFFRGPRGTAAGYGGQALGASLLCCIPAAANDRLCETQPAVAIRQLEAAERALFAAHTQLLALGRGSALERVAGFLVDTAVRRRQSGLDDRAVDAGLTRRDIAESLGLSVETVCRVCAQLKRKGLIEISESHALSLREETRLAALARGHEDVFASPLTQINDGL